MGDAVNYEGILERLIKHRKLILVLQFNNGTCLPGQSHSQFLTTTTLIITII